MNPDGTSDANAVSLYGRDSGTPDNPATFHFTEIDGRGYTAGLKTTSGLHDADIYVDRLIAGSENAWDANNGCQRVRVFVKELILTGGKYVFTAKGGCDALLFKVETMRGNVAVAHTNAGDWSDQNKGVTTGITVDYPAPTTYRQLNATTPRSVGRYAIRSVLTVPFGAFGRKVFMWVFDILKRMNLA